MSAIRVMAIDDLMPGQMKVIKAEETEVLLIRLASGFVAVQPKCPHAGGPLVEGAVCNDRLVCPWHLGTFALPSGALLEPPAMEPLKTYPVRVEHGIVIVETEPIPVRAAAVQTTETPVFVVIGAGAAGAMAITTLRQGGFSGKVIAVDPVVEEPVDRTQLTKQCLSGEMPLEEISIDTFERLQAERLTDSVTKLSAATQTASLSSGRIIKFDKTVVATGGRPKRLEIPGAELAHVIRHPEDVRQFLKAAEKATRVVIIGTSFIGLEAASALVQKGHEVTVAGREKLPFQKQFGAEIAGALMKLHEVKGTRFRLGVEITAISTHGVTVQKGVTQTLVPAELVIMGAGVNPELGFSHDLPIAQNGDGIETDVDLRAADSVWVAGDIANLHGLRTEHWRVAQQHGRVAALGMLGENAKYEGVPFFWTYHFGKRVGYLGHATKWDRTIIEGDLEDMDFIAFLVKDGDVKAVVNCGFETQTAALAELMRGPLPLWKALQATQLD